MSLRTKAIGVAAVAVAAGVLLTSPGFTPGGKDGVDISKRRGYTLLADTDNKRAIIEVHIVSNVRGTILLVEEEKVITTWKYSFWAEPKEVVTMEMDVWTYGSHPLGASVWSRCQILFNGGMVGGDAEVDNIHIKDADDRRKQTHANCAIDAG